VEELDDAAVSEDGTEDDADNAKDSDYEVAEESEDDAESDFEALADESDDDVAESDSEHEIDGEDSDGGHDQDSEVGNDVAKEAATRAQAAGRASYKRPKLQAPEGRGTMQKVRGLTRMGSLGCRSHDHAWASSSRARTDDGAQKERRRVVSQLLKPFGRKRPTYQKGALRQKHPNKESFFQDDKAGRHKQTAASVDAGAKPFAAFSQHLQKKRSQIVAASDRPSCFSRNIRTGLLKRRCLPDTEEEHSDADYPSTQAILDSVPSEDLMQLARSLDARAAACDVE